MIPFLIFFGSFLGSTLFGTIGIPMIVKKIESRRILTSHDAGVMSRKSQTQESKNIRKSSAFKKRLKETMNKIRESSKRGEYTCFISYCSECKTDRETKRILDEKGFSINSGISGNSLHVGW